MCFRCVKGEGEIEKLQAKVVELRRKLDDTTAAMQELGRENQSLQVSTKTQKFQNNEMMKKEALYHSDKVRRCLIVPASVDPFRSNSHRV